MSSASIDRQTYIDLSDPFDTYEDLFK